MLLRRSSRAQRCLGFSRSLLALSLVGLAGVPVQSSRLSPARCSEGQELRDNIMSVGAANVNARDVSPRRGCVDLPERSSGITVTTESVTPESGLHPGDRLGLHRGRHSLSRQDRVYFDFEPSLILRKIGAVRNGCSRGGPLHCFYARPDLVRRGSLCLASDN